MTAKRKITSEEWDPDKNETIKEPEKAVSDPVADLEKKHIEKQKDDTGYFIVEGLPTMGKLYPKGTAIKARSMKVVEVKALSQMTANNANNIINDILKKCVRGIDVDELYTVDKMYLIFWLRANTYQDSGFSVSFSCGECEKPSNYDFQLSNLNIQDFEDERHKKFSKGLVTPSGDKILVKLLQVDDENKNEEFLKNNSTTMIEFDEDVVSLARMIVSINDEKLGTIAKYRYLTEEITPSDFSHIQSFIENYGMGVQPTIDVKCNKCGGSTKTVLPFRPDFFLPKVRS